MPERPSKTSALTVWRARARGVWRDKVRPFCQKAQWPLVWLLAAAALGLGFVGFERAPLVANVPRSELDNLYMSIQLFVLESGAAVGTPNGWLEVARWLAPAVTVYTATKALIAIFQDQLTSLRLLFYRRHVVVCGLGRKGYLLCRAYRRGGERVIVIESDEGNDHIDGCRQEGAVVLLGDAADLATLRKARAHKARLLFSVVGDDGANAETAGQARRLVRKTGGSLTCFVHIDEPHLRDLLSEREFLRGCSDRFRMEFFNVYQEGARALLDSHPPFSAADADRAHPLVVGLGRMGQGLVTQLAAEWYEAGFHTRGRLRITVVDRDPAAKINALYSRHPQVGTLCDLRPWKVDVYSPEFQRAEPLFDGERCVVTDAYVCLDDDARGLYAGLTLLRRLGTHPVSVIVRMMYGAGLSTLLERDSNELAERYSNLHAFNLLDQTCNQSVFLHTRDETIAAVIHADYVRWLKDEGETAETNPYMAPWDELPDALRAKNRQQAEYINAKLALIGCRVEPLADGGVKTFTAGEVERMAKAGHEHWCELRLSEGWTYRDGPKDVERKRSPHLVGWEQLTEKIRESNRRAVHAIPAALAAAGLQVQRAPATSKSPAFKDA